MTTTSEPMPRSVRVLQPFRMIRPTTNPYIVMLHESLRAAGVEQVLFSYRAALFGRYDVVHLHWPETLLGGRDPGRRLARAVLAHLFLLRIRLTRTTVVRTVHNLDLPQGLNRLEYAYLRGLQRATTLHVHLNETTGEQPGDAGTGHGPHTRIPSTTILHGHYREWFARTAARAVETTSPALGRLGFVGLVRRYKNVVGLISAFRVARLSDPTLSLLIAGNPSRDGLVEEIRQEAEGLAEVDLDLRFLSEEELASAVLSCEMVVLPYLHMHNSGVVLTALSLDRPVLVPDNPATRAVAAEVGPGWVLTFEGELTGERLAHAVTQSRSGRGARPDLGAREWTLAGEAHRQAYLHALRLRR